MSKKNQRRIQILTLNEINELYDRPVFNHTEREEYFSLDGLGTDALKGMSKLETKAYLILLIGYFRAKPVIPIFDLAGVNNEDLIYISKTYFSGDLPDLGILQKSTRSKLVRKMLQILDFELITKNHERKLIARLQDVVTICTDPRYIFDECLAFFGQERIALPGYTSIQDTITQVLVTEQKRIEVVLSEHMSKQTVKALQKILVLKGELNKLSNNKGSAKGFSPSEISRELETHQAIKQFYPEIKSLIGTLEVSQGNMTYYASIIKHRSLYKIRRYPKWQQMLYLLCYLFFRYWETNDKLVSAFCYLVRKHNEAAKSFAKKRLAAELEVIRGKLKYAGNILQYFVDDELSDDVQFGDIRKKAFTLISKDEINTLTQHLSNHEFDTTAYQWSYTDSQIR